MERYFNKIKADVLKSSYILIFIYINIMILMYTILCLDNLSDFIFLVEEKMRKFYFFYDILIKVEQIMDGFNLSSTGIFFLFPSQFFLRKKLPLPQAAEKGHF